MARMIGLLFAAAMLIVPAAERAAAQAYPSGPIKMLVGFPPGGTADIIARDIGNELEKAWRQPVIVDNRAGANGALATTQLSKMQADGHNLMTIVSGHITNPLVSPSAGYDAIKDFTPISLVASSPLLIFAHPSFPANDMKGALALARKSPAPSPTRRRAWARSSSSRWNWCPISAAPSSFMCPTAAARRRSTTWWPDMYRSA